MMKKVLIGVLVVYVVAVVVAFVQGRARGKAVAAASPTDEVSEANYGPLLQWAYRAGQMQTLPRR
jgi:arginine utilization protein RocB